MKKKFLTWTRGLIAVIAFSCGMAILGYGLINPALLSAIEPIETAGGY